MVSGLVTSPWDQLRIFSGDARLMRIESKSAIRFALSYGEDRCIFLLYENRSLTVAALSKTAPYSQSRVVKEHAPQTLIRCQRGFGRLTRLLHQFDVET